MRLNLKLSYGDKKKKMRYIIIAGKPGRRRYVSPIFKSKGEAKLRIERIKKKIKYHYKIFNLKERNRVLTKYYNPRIVRINAIANLKIKAY